MAVMSFPTGTSQTPRHLLTTTCNMDLGPSSSNIAESSATAVAAAESKEHMFEKVVTPSDVGKLNRLVIPKQHAEKHLPLDPSAVDKGLLLSFEDPSGKLWRFRYSYWNSSQSYVMTKGWSRFVKEKRLDAGDTVSFARGLGDSKDRLFIDWKRAADAPNPMSRAPPPPPNYYPMLSFASPTPPSSNPWAGRLLLPAAVGFRPAVASEMPMVLESVPVARPQEQAAVKRVRLFGVNLDSPSLSPLQQQQAVSSSSSSPSGNEEQHSLDLEL